MDDILASIRRILNEDEAPPGAAATAPGAPAATPTAPPPAPPRPPAPPQQPIELTESMMVQPPQGPPAASPPKSEPPRPTGSDTLVAPTVAAATTASVGKLLAAVAQERGAAVSRNGPTIEDLVREELRPLLKEWLDQHLPPVVERLVRAEIERVVSRAG